MLTHYALRSFIVTYVGIRYKTITFAQTIKLRKGNAKNIIPPQIEIKTNN